MTRKILTASMILIVSIIFVGCASGDGGQVVSGILQGIGQGLSGL